MAMKSDAKLEDNLWFRKWHEEFGKFLPELLKVSKFELWWHTFIQSKKCMSLTFAEVLFVMTMRNDAKFKEQLTCRFKIDTTIWPDHSHVLKISPLMSFFSPKYIMLELKKFRRLIFDHIEDWCKTWRKTDWCFPKWHEELGKFSQTEK